MHVKSTGRPRVSVKMLLHDYRITVTHTILCFFLYYSTFGSSWADLCGFHIENNCLQYGKTGELPTLSHMVYTWKTEWAAHVLHAGSSPCKLSCLLLPYMETVGSSVDWTLNIRVPIIKKVGIGVGSSQVTALLPFFRSILHLLWQLSKIML